MPLISPIYSDIPQFYQQLLIDGLKQVNNSVDSITQSYVSSSEVKLDKKIIKQLIFLVVLQNCLGINFGHLYNSISSDRAPILRSFIQESTDNFISKSWAYRHSDSIQTNHKSTLEDVSTLVQDFYYTSIGDHARNVFKTQFTNVRQKIVPSIECFFGIIPPSQIFPHFSVFRRGKLMPFLNTLIYQHIQHISSVKEVVSKLKTAEFENFTLSYRLAGRIGFFYRPPKVGDFFFFFGILKKTFQNILPELEKYLET